DDHPLAVDHRGLGVQAFGAAVFPELDAGPHQPLLVSHVAGLRPEVVRGVQGVGEDADADAALPGPFQDLLEVAGGDEVGRLDDQRLARGIHHAEQLMGHASGALAAHRIVQEADALHGDRLLQRRTGSGPHLTDAPVEPFLVAVQPPRGLLDLGRRRLEPTLLDVMAVPEGEEIGACLRCRAPPHLDVAIDIVPAPELLGAEPEVGALDVAPAGDDQLVVHAAGDPVEVPETEGVVGADLDPFAEQVGLDGRRDLVPLVVDEQLHPHAAAGRVAQQRQGGQGERVLADDEVAGEDLLASVEDHLGAGRRRLALALEQADLVRSRQARQEADGEQEGPETAQAGRRGHGDNFTPETSPHSRSLREYPWLPTSANSPCTPARRSAMGDHPEVDRTLERLVRQLREAAGSNLLGIALFGSLAKGRYTPGISDINVLIVVEDASLPSLLPLAPILTVALRDDHVVPFVVTPADLLVSAVLFPVKILDIQLWHRLLWGDIHIANIEVQPEALRLRSLQELKSMELRMRLRIVERGDDPDVLWRGLVRNLPKLAVTLEVLLRSRGVEVPVARAGVLRQAAEQLGIPVERIEPIAVLRRNDRRPDDGTVRQLLAVYLETLAEICRHVEGEVG